MKNFEKDLRAIFDGECYFDEMSRHIYSVDASIFEILPLAIVKPKTREELQKIFYVAQKHQIPIIARGAATGITGGCLGKGLIIDLSKYFTKILSINLDKQTVVCEPGVVQDDLNTFLSDYGFRLGPDTSTGNRATLGGMLANNAAGARSLRYGKMVDHIESVELLLSTGEFIECRNLDEEEQQKKRALNTQEGKIYRALKIIQDNYSEEISKKIPQIPRYVSGYNLGALLSPSFNTAKIIAGSEGTLGIVTKIEMKIVPKLQTTGILLFSFSSLIQAFNYISELLPFSPLSLEFIDEIILSTGRQAPSLKGKLDWISEDVKTFLMFEIEGETSFEVSEKLKEINHQLSYKGELILEPIIIQHLWELRKAGLGILLSKRSYTRAIAFIEDLSIPPLHLADFIGKFLDYLKSIGKEAGIYGHAGSGCIHIRPYIDLRDSDDKKLMLKMMRDISTLILDFGGAMSGEHGDGWIRSWLNPKMFGSKMMQAFQLLKEGFDPLNIMNPGKIIPTQPPFDQLRNNVDEELESVSTFLNFEAEGGFALAVDLCNGNGACRKDEGIMCPSFQATKDEYHSTRARAQALRSLIHKKISSEELSKEALYDVLDLCLSCKGCKTECPSQIDMAKMKSEVFYHYQEKQGYSLRSKLFGKIDLVYRLISPFKTFFNYLSKTQFFKKTLNFLKITSKRPFPKFSKKYFSKWFSEYEQKGHFKNKVYLLNDTFTEFLHPEVGIATIELLNRIGYEVGLVPWSCCGRPALSKGLLDYARQKAKKLVEELIPYTAENLPIIGIEPSCLLTIKDDYKSLLSKKDRLQPPLEKILSQLTTLDEFLDSECKKPEWKNFFSMQSKTVLFHGHCYQKALVGMTPTVNVLKSIPNLLFKEIPSGCCGMAGSFGYEKEHEELSFKIGELILFPIIREKKENEDLIANGTSCRQQIFDGTGIQALHLAEFIRNRLK